MEAVHASEESDAAVALLRGDGCKRGPAAVAAFTRESNDDDNNNDDDSDANEGGLERGCVDLREESSAAGLELEVYTEAVVVGMFKLLEAVAKRFGLLLSRLLSLSSLSLAPLLLLLLLRGRSLMGRWRVGSETKVASFMEVPKDPAEAPAPKPWCRLAVRVVESDRAEALRTLVALVGTC